MLFSAHMVEVSKLPVKKKISNSLLIYKESRPIQKAGKQISLVLDSANRVFM